MNLMILLPTSEEEVTVKLEKAKVKSSGHYGDEMTREKENDIIRCELARKCLLF